jgi:hypothetical protein
MYRSVHKKKTRKDFFADNLREKNKISRPKNRETHMKIINRNKQEENICF